MKKTSALLIGLGLFLAALPLPGQEVVEEIVAIVNDEIITLSQARGQFDLYLEQIRS